MIKNYCKKPHCIYWAMPRYEYCRKHQKELETKSELYYNGLQENTKKQNKRNVKTDVLKERRKKCVFEKGRLHMSAMS